jgi:aspartyl-tRNA synthetase
MAFATQEDVFAEVEVLMVRIVGELSVKHLRAPFPCLTFAEAIARYGTDKPDLRFGLTIADVSDALGGSTELPMFQDAPAKGHAIRALRIPDGAGRPRRWFDTYAESARKAGAVGSWLQLEPGEGGSWEARGALARRLTPAEVSVFAEAVDAVAGDAVLTAVGPAAAASTVLGEQRGPVGRELGLADPDELAFCWIVDFPMYERNEETGGWDFSHNPFSMPQGGLEALQTRDPGDILAYQYDVVCNGIELSSGAVRNHLPSVMEAAFAIAGYGPERIQQAFPALWHAFHYGAPPHAGIAPGFDRLLMILEDQANLREVIAFPLNQTARDLLMGAPSPVPASQLRELGISIIPAEDPDKGA